MAAKKCPHCGESLATPKPRRKVPSIALKGRTFPQQKAWYLEAMRVKRGELVWSPDVNADRFGARGGYVPAETLERAS